MIQKLKKLLLLICVFSVHTIYAQTTTISGTITDSLDGMALPGVNIVEMGTSNGAITDIDGNYTIIVSYDNAVLQFTFLGYKDTEIAVNGQTVIDVALEESSEVIDEIVVTSLGLTREKKSLGYSVTKLDGNDVSRVKESNVASSLAGKVAGVVVSKSTSGAGGSTRVVIRGNNSISGNNQPLYVVDGVPIDNTTISSPDTFEFNVPDLGNGISDINPDDIESMSVLKGPNAAALYGSRASNGVIIITTKRGKLDQGLGVSFSSSTTFEDPFVLPKYQNQYGRGSDGNFPSINPADDILTQVNLVRGSDSWGPTFDGSQQLAYNGEQRAYEAQPNNVKDFFETGTSTINTLSLSNSNEKSSVRFSYTNSDIGSILPGSSVKRHNFNLRGYAKLSDKLTLDSKVTYFVQEARNRPNQGTQGVMAYLLTMPRNISNSDLQNYQNLENPLDPANPYAVIGHSLSSFSGNPYWVQNEDFNQDQRKRFSGFVKLDYQITDWLSAFVRAGTDDVSQDTQSYFATGHHFVPRGSIAFGNNDRTESNYDALLMLNKDLDEKFNLSANIGGNFRKSTAIRSSINGRDFKIPGGYFLNNTEANLAESSQSDLIEKRVNSIYGSASLAYDNMIYLDITGRNDWSSALPEENRSYFYSSLGLSVLLNKVFDLDNTPINFLKLRGSSASVGNDTDAQQLSNVFKVGAQGYLGNITIGRPNIKFSESLKPEDITSTEIGLEFKMFDNRFYGDFSYYSISSKDLIFDVPVDPGTGYEFFRDNVGELTNKGFELLLGGTPVKTENFRWDTSINLSKNKNKLVSLIDGQDNFTFSNSNSGIVDVRAEVNDGFGDIYTTTWLRDDAGQLLLTSDGRPQATSDRQKAGNYQPDVTGGFSNTFKYNNFTLNVLIDFRFGGEVFSYTDAAMDAAGVSERSLQFREGGLVVEGLSAIAGTDPVQYETNTSTISAEQYWTSVAGVGSEYVYDQTNMRLRELSLSYRFPNKVLEKTFMESASLSLIGRNLFFISKKTDNFDPEASYSSSNLSQGVLFYALPTTRSLGFSLNVNF